MDLGIFLDLFRCPTGSANYLLVVRTRQLRAFSLLQTFCALCQPTRMELTLHR
jgi:hypothetical protein